MGPGCCFFRCQRNDHTPFPGTGVPITSQLLLMRENSFPGDRKKRRTVWNLICRYQNGEQSAINPYRKRTLWVFSNPKLIAFLLDDRMAWYNVRIDWSTFSKKSTPKPFKKNVKNATKMRGKKYQVVSFYEANRSSIRATGGNAIQTLADTKCAD